MVMITMDVPQLTKCSLKKFNGRNFVDQPSFLVHARNPVYHELFDVSHRCLGNWTVAVLTSGARLSSRLAVRRLWLQKKLQKKAKEKLKKSKGH